MEDRGVSPRGQAVDGDRGLPVPGFSHPAQPHSVRITGVESSEGSGLPNRADHLPDQARLAARLPRPTTQESHGSNGSCVSPKGSEYGGNFEPRVLEKIVSREANVRAAANRVALGEADATFVYLSDVTPGIS